MPSTRYLHESGQPLLPGGTGIKHALPRKFCACVFISIIVMFALVFHTNLLIPTENNADMSLPGRTIQSLDDNEGEEIEQALADTRRLLEDEMRGYVYGKNRVNVSQFSDLVPELGGQPLRTVVVTSWRSGSTFLGDVLNSHPGNWYHYEPLLDFDIVQVRGPPLAETALANLQHLLKCNYSGMENYLEFGKRHVFLFTHNTRLWNQCELHPNLCWRADFLTPMCKLFPVQSMKIVRLRLRLAEELLKDKSLGIKMLYMVRDPRGTLQSRRHRDWCPGNPDCENPKLLCADLADDYYAAVKLSKKYPKDFRVVRYEDLSMEPYKGAKVLLEFFNLNFHPQVQLFLDTHTKENVGGVSSTFRDSKTAPFHWRKDFDYKEVESIQNLCTEAMSLWGYLPAKNRTHQATFNPLTSYQLK